MLETRKVNPLLQAIESENNNLRSSVQKLKQELQQSKKAKLKIEKEYNQLKLKLEYSTHITPQELSPAHTPVNNEEQSPPRKHNNPNNSYRMAQANTFHDGANQSFLQTPDTSLILRYVKRRSSMGNSRDTPQKKRKLSTLAQKRKQEWPDVGTILTIKKHNNQRFHREDYYDKCLKKK